MKNYLIWTKHGEGSSAPYTTRNPVNIDMLVDGFQFVHKTQQPFSQSEPIVPNVTDHGFVGGNEGVRTHILPNVTDEEDEEFLEAILCRYMDPSMFFMRGMETLMKAGKEPFYDKSKGCTKEFTTFRSVLKLLMLKARHGLSNVGFDMFLSVTVAMLPKENKVPANMYYTMKLTSPQNMGIVLVHRTKV